MARRGTGSYWRGHKLYATLTIPSGTELTYAHDRSTTVTYRDMTVSGWRACRSDGTPMSQDWNIDYGHYGAYVPASACTTTRHRVVDPRKKK